MTFALSRGTFALPKKTTVMTRSRLQSVLFDFNGTLFQDESFHEQAWQVMGMRHGREILPGEIANQVLGFANKEILTYLFGPGLTENTVRDLSEEKEQIYRDLCTAKGPHIALAPGAETFLNFLTEHRIPRTIATASIRSNVLFFFERFNLNRWFQFESVAYDDGLLRGKPYPDLYSAAAQRLGVPTQTSMAIEDSLGGIRAAASAGVGYITAVSEENGSSKFAGIQEVDLVISDFSEIDRNLFKPNQSVSDRLS